MDFDKPINRVGSNSTKWDGLTAYKGLVKDYYREDAIEDTIAMWVADMDFESPPAVGEALRKMADFGVYGYMSNTYGCNEAIANWMKRRHNWDVDPDHIQYTQGLVNAVSIALMTFTNPGDEIVLFTPVYHAFARAIVANNRVVKEMPLVINNGRYEYDFAAYDQMISGKETMVINCSPLNPGGRVWEADELSDLAEFVERHNLMLISDEVHQDITFGKKFLPQENVSPQIEDRLITLVAGSKVFNLAGGYCGSAIIKDEKLREAWLKTKFALNSPPGMFSIAAVQAAYETGDKWVDELCDYIDGNIRLFNDGVNKIPGLKAMELEATYLAWVDFQDTGMDSAEYQRRVIEDAKIAPNYGETFGKGGETFLRFNLGTQRSNVIEAVERLQRAFSDLQ